MEIQNLSIGLRGQILDLRFNQTSLTEKVWGRYPSPSSLMRTEKASLRVAKDK